MELPHSDETSLLLQLTADARTTNYVAVASLAWLFYDHLITLHEEVKLIWIGSKWKSVMKIFYIWNRYFCAISLSLLTALRLTEIKSDRVCRVFYWLEGTICIAIITTVDCVLVMRVWILYNRSRRLLYLLIPLILMEITVMILIDVLVVPAAQAYIHIGPALTGCYPHYVPRYLTLYAVPPLIVSLIMFAMTLYKCLATLRFGVAGRMPIISLFFRDGVFWFLGVLVTIGATIINWSAGKQTLVELTNTPSVVVFSLIASHALLNIKRMINADVVDGSLISHYDSGNFETKSIIFQAIGDLSTGAAGDN